MISQTTRRWFWWDCSIGDDDDDDDKNMEGDPVMISGVEVVVVVELNSPRQHSCPWVEWGEGPRFRSHHFFSNSYVAL